MKRTRTAILSVLCFAGALALPVAMSTGLQGCSFFEKKAKTVADDVKTCFGPDVKGDLGDLVKGIGTSLICDLASGGNALPACTIEGLQTIADEIGPNGKKDVQCVVQKLAQDAAGEKVGASPEETIQTQRAKLLVKAQALSLLSPGDPTPKTGPTCSATSPLVNSCPSGSTYYGSRDGNTGCFDAEWRWLGPANPPPCRPTLSLAAEPAGS